MWQKVKASSFIEFNPKEILPKGKIAKKIAMENITPWQRRTNGYVESPFSGGQKFRNNDVAMARITPCLENGKTAQISGLEHGEVAFGSTEFIILRGRPNISDSSYIYYLSISPMWRRIAIKSMVGSSGRQRVQQSVLENMEIFAPPLAQQKGIASILSILDDKIELNQKINHNLEQQAQAIFKSWFVDFEPFRDGEFVDSELGPIPKGWRAGALVDICALIAKGNAPRYSEFSEELVINQKCIRDNKIDLSLARRHMPKRKTDRWIKYGDILINSTGTGTLGRAAQVGFRLDHVTVDSHVTIVRPKISELADYLGEALLGMQHIFESMASGSTGQTDLPRERLMNMPILLPAESALNQFSRLREQLSAFVIKNQNESQHLAALRDTLLPKLMSGEIDVSDVKI